MHTSLTPERLRELLSYDPVTGVFVWRVHRQCVRAGAIAGRVTPKGHRQIRVDGVFYFAHRLAWLYVHGEWPADQIDHIDLDKANNAIANLREATHALNMQNKQCAHANNCVGLLGVSRVGRKFVARIGVNGRDFYLGSHETAEKAHAAYVSAKRKVHPGGTL